MTSRVLFSRLLKEELRKKIWIIAATLLAAILAGPVTFLLRYENYAEYMLPSELSTAMLELMRPSEVGDVLLTTGMAVLIAIAGYQYLFSKKQVDLYHSIPVKREKLFMVSYISGLCIYFGVYLIQTMILIMAAIGKGVFTNEAGIILLHTIAGNIVHFLLIYHVTIIAVILTGNILVSFAAAGTLLLYGLITSQIIWMYYTSYFSTYYSIGSITGVALWKKIPFISPIASYIYFVNSCSQFSDATVAQQVGHLIVTFLFSVILLVLAVYLYKKRPSEAAGKALAFRKTEVVIRMLIVIITSLTGGLLIVNINNKPDSTWFWFGLILACILSHCLIEMIYRFDFKAFYHHKIQLVICLLIAVFIGIIFREDLFGYDTYLPQVEQIRNAGIIFTNVDTDMMDYQFDHVDENGIVYGEYDMGESSQLKNYALQNTAVIQELGKLGIEQLNVLDGLDNNYYKSFGMDSKGYMSDNPDEQKAQLYYVIRYTLNNGKNVYRHYAVDVESAKDLFAKIYDSEEYKEIAYDIIPLQENDVFKRVEVYDIWGNKQLSLTKNEMKDFLTVYIDDMMHLTAEVLETEAPVARVSPFFRVETYEESLGGYYIYPSFKNTLNAMQKLGVNMEDMTTKINVEELESIKVNDCGYLSEALGMTDQYSPGKIYVNTEDEDQKMIEDLCNNLTNSNYTWSNLVLCPYEQRIEFELLYKTSGGIQKTGYAYMKSGQILQKVIDDLVDTVETYQ